VGLTDNGYLRQGCAGVALLIRFFSESKSRSRAVSQWLDEPACVGKLAAACPGALKK